MSEPQLNRYIRQVMFPPLGEAGQKRILAGRVLICGCGALGTYLANTLVRAGVGHVRIVDRDFVDLSNLQRQVLFEEQDVEDCIPKAIAAAERLRRINSEIEIEPVVADLDHTNAESLLEGMDVIADGTDNFETRFLLNDASIKYGIPWVYGGCLAAEGQTMTILPGETPCLRCLMNEAPPPGTMPTCDTAGILASVIGVIASIEAAEVLKILSGNRQAVNRKLIAVDLWDNRYREVDISALKAAGNCPTCGDNPAFPYLEGAKGSHTTVLCGRNAVQLAGMGDGKLSLSDLAGKLKPLGTVTQNPFLLRFSVDDYVLTVFPDGRAIVGGTEDIAVAKNLYARYVGA